MRPFPARHHSPRRGALRSSAIRLGALALALPLLAACSSARVQGVRLDDGRDAEAVRRLPSEPSPMDQRTTIPTIGTPSGVPGVSAETRRLCRTEASMSGWIAIEYFTSSVCPVPAGAEDQPNAAVIARFEGLPTGTVLHVCANQAVPARWVPDAERADDDYMRCRGAAPEGRTTIRRIKRLP